MDIKRSGRSKLKKRIRTAILILVGLAAVSGIVFGLTKVKPALPTLDRSTAVIDVVKRGQMMDTDELLAKQGLVPDLLLKTSRVKVASIATRLKVEQQRLAISGTSTKAQMNAQESRLQRLQGLAKLKRDQVGALRVRAGTIRVQQVTAQVGQQVTPGLNIARVADPELLKAELKL